MLGSWWLLAMVVAAVYLGSPVRDATEHDPAFVPLTAHELVHHGTVALDRFGAERLVGHPVVLTDGSLDPGFVVAGVGSPGWEQLRTAVEDPDVEVRDYFPWPTALLAVPGVVLGDLSAAVTGGPDSRELIVEHRFAFVHTTSASLVVIGAVLALRAAALVVLGGPWQRRRIVANAAVLVIALGTSAYSTASRALWQHTPSLLLLSVAMWCAVRIDRGTVPDDRDFGVDDAVADRATRSPRPDPWVVALAASLTAASLARPTNLGVAAILLGWVLLRRRRDFVPTLASAMTGAAVVAGTFLVVSRALVGRVLPEYYSAGRLRLGDWFPEAVAANWVSPSRGLLIASPILLLAVPGTVRSWRSPDRHRRALVVCLWLAVLAITLSVSAFPQWWAGHSFGPRFTTEAVPLLFVLSLPAWDLTFDPVHLGPDAPHRSRAIVAVVVVTVLSVWSVGFHAMGSVAGATGCWNRYPDDIDDDPSRVWSIADSQVLEPLHRMADPRRRAEQDAVCPARSPG